jgi:hypothetical protein
MRTAVRTASKSSTEMAIDAGVQRRVRRNGKRAAAFLPSATGAPAEDTIPFAVHGELSDSAIEALASLLLAVAEQDRTEQDVAESAEMPRTRETTA